MVVSVLQLNINADNYFDVLQQYLKKNTYDIICLQELAGIGTVIGNIDCTHDTFLELQKLLSPDYVGEFILTDHIDSADTAYFGNAIFYKKSFTMIDKRNIYFKKNDNPFPHTVTTFEDVGRGMLHLILQKDEKNFSILTTHFAWGPTPVQIPHQTKQGQILLNYLQSISAPYILTGDLNITPEQPLITSISSLATNLTQKYAVENTLDPKNHRAKKLFPPGYAVDYIFITDDLKEKSFTVIQEELSDHYGLSAEIEV